jgi:hypothetical protein
VSEPETAFVLGGGGLLGAAAVGRLQELWTSRLESALLVALLALWVASGFGVALRRPRFERAVPDGREAQVRWLYDWWARIDAWVGEQKAVQSA